MADGRRPDGSYGPEYGPLPPEHEYAMYRHLPSRGRAPWPLQHGDYPGRLLEQRLRREPFGFSRHPLHPYAPFRIHRDNGGDGVAMNPRRRREDPGLSHEEFRMAMDQLRKQEYRPSNSNPHKKQHHQTRTQRAGAPAAAAATEEEKTACTICLETFQPGEQVMITPCNHMFHQECITPWVKGHGNCPVCRSALCERRNAAVTGNINSSGVREDSVVDLDLLAMMRAMEEAFSRVRLSDFMSYHH